MAAMTTSVSAWLPFRRGFQPTPKSCSATARMPTEGENKNSHSTPTTAGDTAYGQISSVLYRPEPHMTRSTNTAISSDTARPTKATSPENKAGTRQEYRSSGRTSWQEKMLQESSIQVIACY